VPSPNEGTADNILYGIGYDPGYGWSAGTFSDGINGRTLTLRYDDPCTPTPTPTATAGEACRVDGASCDDVSSPPTDFGVFVSCPAGSCNPGGFTVNGVRADSCAVIGIQSVSFHFNTSAVVPGFNTLHVQSGAIFCSAQCFFRRVEEFTCTFRYFPPSPTPTPTAPSPPNTPTPTPTPIPTPPIPGSGGRYNPRTDSWTDISTTNAPSVRNGHTAIWTGNEMAYLNTGGKYCAQADPTPRPRPTPHPRR
jgi:hypothetical protein